MEKTETMVDLKAVFRKRLWLVRIVCILFFIFTPVILPVLLICYKIKFPNESSWDIIYYWFHDLWYLIMIKKKTLTHERTTNENER